MAYNAFGEPYSLNLTRSNLPDYFLMYSCKKLINNDYNCRYRCGWVFIRICAVGNLCLNVSICFRVAAFRCRQKKKGFVTSLENKVAELQSVNEALEASTVCV